MMGLPFLPALDAPRLVSATGGLELKTLSYLGAVFALVEPHTLENAFDFLDETKSAFDVPFAVHLDVSALTSIDDVVSILDAGAAKVFVSYHQLQDLEKSGNLDQSRCVLKISSHEYKPEGQIIDAIRDTAVGVYHHEVPDIGWLHVWLNELGENRPLVYVSLARSAVQDVRQTYADLIKLSCIPIIPAASLTVDEETSSTLLQVGSLVQVNSDRPDGLLSTIVTDEHGVALGLVFSTPRSIQESLRTGRGVYHSRKRGLWYKGESSGDVQELVRIQVDCDCDCLRFVVRQRGRGTSHGDACIRFSTELLSESRLLSFGYRYMLRTLQRSLSPATDSTGTQDILPTRFILCTTLLLSITPSGQDHGGSR